MSDELEHELELMHLFDQGEDELGELLDQLDQQVAEVDALMCELLLSDEAVRAFSEYLQ